MLCHACGAALVGFVVYRRYSVESFDAFWHIATLYDGTLFVSRLSIFCSRKFLDLRFTFLNF